MGVTEPVKIKINRVDLAWLAGLMEGEGTFYLNNQHPHRSETYLYPKVVIGMTDEDIIKRVHQIMRFGKVWGPYRPPSRSQHQASWHWLPRKSTEALATMKLLQPHLGQRRQEQIQRVLEGHTLRHLPPEPIIEITD